MGEPRTLLCLTSEPQHSAGCWRERGVEEERTFCNGCRELDNFPAPPFTPQLRGSCSQPPPLAPARPLASPGALRTCWLPRAHLHQTEPSSHSPEPNTRPPFQHPTHTHTHTPYTLTQTHAPLLQSHAHLLTLMFRGTCLLTLGHTHSYIHTQPHSHNCQHTHTQSTHLPTSYSHTCTYLHKHTHTCTLTTLSPIHV